MMGPKLRKFLYRSWSRDGFALEGPSLVRRLPDLDQIIHFEQHRKRSRIMLAATVPHPPIDWPRQPTMSWQVWGYVGGPLLGDEILSSSSLDSLRAPHCWDEATAGLLYDLFEARFFSRIQTFEQLAAFAVAHPLQNHGFTCDGRFWYGQEAGLWVHSEDKISLAEYIEQEKRG